MARLRWLGWVAETVRDAVKSGYKLRTFPSGGLAYLWFNHRDQRPTSELRLRQAIALIFDSHTYVNNVIAIPGYRSTNTFFPAWLRGVEKRFVDEYPPAERPTDIARARALVAGLKLDRPLTLLTVTSPTGTKVAEYLQGLIKSQLGLDVIVDQQTFKQYLSKARAGDFDLVMSSWYPDFDDIVTYADLLVSWNPNNRGGYVSQEYDRYFRILQSAAEPETRFSAAGELQRIIAQDVPVLPMAETGSAYVTHSRLKGVTRRVMGPDPDFTGAYIVPSSASD